MEIRGYWVHSLPHFRRHFFNFDFLEIYGGFSIPFLLNRIIPMNSYDMNNVY